MNLFNFKEEKGYRKLIITAIFIVTVCLIVYFCIFRYAGIAALFSKIFRILRPIFYGIIIAYLLTPVYNLLYRKFLQIPAVGKWKHGKILSKVLSIILSLALIVFVVYAFFALLIPAIYSSARDFILNIPTYAENLQNMLKEYFATNPDMESWAMGIYDNAYDSLNQWLTDNLIPNMNSVPDMISWFQTNILPHLATVLSDITAIVKGTISFVIDTFVGLIVAAYILATKTSLAAQAKKIQYAIFPTKTADFIIAEAKHDNDIFGGFIIGKIIDSFIIGLITFVALSIMKMPYVIVVSIVVGVTNIIPFFGPFIGAIPSAILIFLVDPVKALYFLVYILAVQQFDGNVLGPKILGQTVGLPGLWVIFSILLFGGLFGFVGMVIGVPVFAIIYSMIRRFTNYLLKKRDLPTDTRLYDSPNPIVFQRAEASASPRAAADAEEAETARAAGESQETAPRT